MALRLSKELHLFKPVNRGSALTTEGLSDSNTFCDFDCVSRDQESRFQEDHLLHQRLNGQEGHCHVSEVPGRLQEALLGHFTGSTTSQDL